MATRRRRELPDYGMSNIGEEVDDAPIDECSSDSDGAGLSEPDGDPAQSEVSVSANLYISNFPFIPIFTWYMPSFLFSCIFFNLNDSGIIL